MNGLAIDNKAFKQVEEFLKDNPEATYQEITEHIKWYFEEDNFYNFSPWITDWILLCMEEYKMKKLLLPDEAENEIDWFDVIKTGLLFILCVGLLMLTFAPFMWR